MRIAYLTLDDGVPVFGRKGCSIHVQEVIRALLRKGHAVELFTPRGEGIPSSALERWKTHHLPVPGAATAEGRERACSNLNSIVREFLDQSRAGAVSCSADKRGFDLLYERYSLWSYAGQEWAREHGLPGVLEVNAPLIDEQRKHRGLVNEAAAREGTLRAFTAATTIIAVSDDVAAWVRGVGVSAQKVHVVPNGVDVDRFAPAELDVRRDTDATRFTIGFVGSLKPWHGVDVLLEAVGLVREVYPDIRLRIVGDGPERERLQDFAEARGLANHIEWIGAVDPSNVPALLNEVDVAAAPYPRLEGFYFSPLKVFEYMAAGRAIIASRIGQIPGILKHGATGWLVPPGDPDALAQAILHLHARPALRRRLASRARGAACRHHTWDHVAAKILSLSKNDFGRVMAASVATGSQPVLAVSA